MNLGLCVKISYGIGHVLNDLCASMWFTYTLVFYGNVVGFSSKNSGAIVFVGQIADALSTPVVGLLSDRVRSYWMLKYGKRKTWHLIGTICVIIATPFMYSPCISCQDAKEVIKLVYYCVFVVIFQFGWASVQISHLSLVPDLTPDENERTSLLSIRYSCTVLSNLAVYLITWLVLEISNSGTQSLSPSDMIKFQEIAYVITCAGAITSIIFHCSIKERFTAEPLLEGENIDKPTPRASMIQIFSRLQLYQVACVYMASRLFSNISQSLIPLYIQDFLLLNAQSLAIVPFVMFVSSFATSLITRPMNAFCGRKVAFFIGGLVGIAGCLWAYFGEGYVYSTYCIYIIAIFFGSASSVLIVTSLAITADHIGNDVGNGALIYGLMSFTDKLSNGAAILVIQFLDPVGIPAGVPNNYYRDALVYVCGVSAILGVVSVLTIFSLLRRSDSELREGIDNAAIDINGIDDAEIHSSGINAEAIGTNSQSVDYFVTPSTSEEALP